MGSLIYVVIKAVPKTDRIVLWWGTTDEAAAIEFVRRIRAAEPIDRPQQSIWYVDTVWMGDPP